MFGKVALTLDRMGLRRLVATAANLAYSDQRFSVDEQGRWVNAQAGGTIVSLEPHTYSLSNLRERILDEWCYKYTPGPEDIIVDAGAGIGEEALIFSPMVASVVSIEAQPKTYSCLLETVRLSGLKNVRPVFAALADEEGTARIDDAGIASSILSGGGIEVPQITVRSLNLHRIDLLRMNIEGAERLAIYGVPWERVRNAVISCHDFIGVPAKAEVREVLEREGFEIETTQDAPEPWVRDYIYASR